MGDWDWGSGISRKAGMPLEKIERWFRKSHVPTGFTGGQRGFTVTTKTDRVGVDGPRSDLVRPLQPPWQISER